jgi:photosystem II stability/assembly factor-like uncharacterized protein
MNDKIDIEAALRASLAEHARHAPAAGLLAERVIADVDPLSPAREPRRARQWRTWTLPLIAAGSVAAIAAALVGVSQFQHTADHERPAVQLSSVVPLPTHTPTTVASPPPSSPTITPHQTKPGVAVAPVPSNFTVLDLTFASADEGWALGSSDCLTGGGTCTALVHTADGGDTWQGMPTPPATVTGVGDCADPCVRSIRFANDQIGYAYGPSAFFMTTNGGKSWQREPGGADALETLDGNVIRVAARNACSPPGCVYGVQIAPLGSVAWHDVGLSATTTGSSVGVALARTGHRAFVEVFGHTSGGGQNATSALYTSADDGVTWAARGEPCPQSGGEIDSTAITTAPDGSVTVLCTRRGARGTQFTSTSTDGGATFRAGGPLASGSSPGGLLGAASAQVQFVISDALYRTQDGGQTWRSVPAVSLGPGTAIFVGFESAAVGRAVTDSGRTVWTTRDAGLTWTAHTFH